MYINQVLLAGQSSTSEVTKGLRELTELTDGLDAGRYQRISQTILKQPEENTLKNTAKTNGWLLFLSEKRNNTPRLPGESHEDHQKRIMRVASHEWNATCRKCVPVVFSLCLSNRYLFIAQFTTCRNACNRIERQ